MNNVEIRKAAQEAGVYLYEIAAEYGVNDGNFSRKLRWELPDTEKTRILQIIARLATDKQKNAHIATGEAKA